MVSIMGMLAVCVLVCAVMVQIKAAAVPHVESKRMEETKGLKKNWGCCGKDWTWINNRCFRYMPEAKSWAQAAKSCSSMGATLASVHSIEEEQEIKSLTAASGYKDTWIGGSNAQEESVWLWSDGSTFGFTNWCSGEPNNAGGHQHCLRINYPPEKCWDDFGCNEPRPYICARKM